MKKIDDYNKVTDRLEVKRDCFMEAINMIEQKSDKRHKWSKRKIIPVFAAAVVGCAAMTAVFADDISNIFRKAENKRQITVEGADGERYQVDKVDKLNYSEIEKHAEILSEECETNGLKVKAESVFCDGENLMVIFTAENNNPDIPDDYHIWAKGITVEIDGKPFSDLDNMCIPWLDLVRDYEGASTYTGTLQISIPEENRFTDTTEVKIHIGVYESAGAWENGNIDDYYSYCKENNKDYSDKMDAEEYYSQFNTSADFLINVTPDTSANASNTEKLSDGDIEIAEVKSTPYALSVKYKVPIDSDYILMVYDENGNKLDLNLENQGDFDGVYAISNFTSTDSKVVTLEFVDKNSEDLNVVSSFEVPIN